MAYRVKFHGDVLIDLVGYRRHGHNETDEAGIHAADHGREDQGACDPCGNNTPRRWKATGTVPAGEGDAQVTKAYNHLLEIQTSFRANHQGQESAIATPPEPVTPGVFDTGVAAEQLTALNDQLLVWPSTFAVHPKVNALLQRRKSGLTAAGGIDWGHAEALALASLLVEDTPVVRLTRAGRRSRYLLASP